MAKSIKQLLPSTEILWPLIIWVGLLFFISLVPVVPNDIWWHLKIGEQIFTTHEIPTTNQFAWSIPRDQPYHYGAWLGELLLYLCYKLGRLDLAIFARNLMGGLFFGLIVNETWRRSGSWRLGALSLALAGCMTLNNLIVRPQIWSWVPFMLFLLILGCYAQRKVSNFVLLALPLIMTVWVNLHGAFILGVVLIGIYSVGEAIRTQLHSENALSWYQVRWIGASGLLTGIAMLANPRGAGIISYLVDLMTNKPSQSLITEWQSPKMEGFANTAFFISLILLLVIVAVSRYRLTPTDILLIIGFLWLALQGQRYVIWFGAIAMPILAQAVNQLQIPKLRLTNQRNWLNVTLILVLLLPVMLVQPWWVENFPIPDPYWDMVHKSVPQGPLIDANTPLEAVEYLRAYPGGEIFNEMGYGSYLIWALPEQRVFIDPRVELYSYEMWQDYIRITNATRYNQLLEEYGVNRILLDRNLQPELSLALSVDPGWSLEHEDEHSQIWHRAND